MVFNEKAMDLHDYEDVAQRYDLYTKDTDNMPDGFSDENVVSFHMELAKKYGSKGILDLGCGTGILTVPLSQKGYSVCAVDKSGPMIEMTKKKLLGANKSIPSNVKLMCSEMHEFSTEERYSLAIIARTGFMHILGCETQRKALININRHLKAGGILTMNTFYPNHMILAGQIKNKTDDRFKRFEYVNAAGRAEIVYNSGAYDPENQIMSGTWRFEEYEKDGKLLEVRERPLKLRFTFRKEMEYLFELTGFKIKEVYGDYLKNEAKYPSWLIWVVEKRESR